MSLVPLVRSLFFDQMADLFRSLRCTAPSHSSPSWIPMRSTLPIAIRPSRAPSLRTLPPPTSSARTPTRAPPSPPPLSALLRRAIAHRLSRRALQPLLQQRGRQIRHHDPFVIVVPQSLVLLSLLASRSPSPPASRLAAVLPLSRFSFLALLFSIYPPFPIILSHGSSRSFLLSLLGSSPLGSVACASHTLCSFVRRRQVDSCNFGICYGCCAA